MPATRHWERSTLTRGSVCRTACAQIVAKGRAEGDGSAILRHDLEPQQRSAGEVDGRHIVHRNLRKKRRQSETHEAHIMTERKPRRAAVARTASQSMDDDPSTIVGDRALGANHTPWIGGASQGILDVANIARRKGAQGDVAHRHCTKRVVIGTDCDIEPLGGLAHKRHELGGRDDNDRTGIAYHPAKSARRSPPCRQSSTAAASAPGSSQHIGKRKRRRRNRVTSRR